MGIKLRGFTIPISGDTKELRKAFKEIDTEVKEITAETNALKRSLKTDWNMQSFVKAQATATDAVNATEERVGAVKKALADLGNADTDKAKEQVKLLTVKLIDAETAASKAKKSLAEIAGSEFKNNLSKANTEIDLTKRKLDTLTTGFAIHWDKTTFTQAQAAAREAVDKTNEKVRVLQSELKRLGNDGKTDKTASEFNELSVQIDETKLKARQAEKQLQDINQVKFDRITDKIGKIGDNLLKSGGVLTAGVTLPLAYVGKKALDTASDLVEVQNIIDVSFKESAKSVNEWSKSLLDSNGISELTAKQNAGLYKSMANGMGVADEAGTEMSMTLTELIGDVASFKDLSFEAVGTKLKSVFTGETESLKDIGVVMTEANVNAFALANGMEKLSNDMSQSDKVALRYKFVIDALKDAQGDFARTIDSTANQQKLAQERFKSLSVELATELLPIATDVLKWANDLMKSFSGMSDETKKATLMILGLAAGLGPAITLLGGVAKGASSTVKWVGSLKKANDAATVSQAALNATMSLNPYYFVAAALAAVAVGITVFATANDEATQKQKELINAFNESVDAYDNYIDSVEQDTQAKNAELDVAEKLIERYGILNGKVNKTSTEKIVLQNTVRELSSLLGIEFTLLDTEAIKFDNTTASLKNLIQVRREEIVQIATRNKAIKAQETLLDLEEQIPKLEDSYWKAGEKIESKWAFSWDKKAFKEADEARNAAQKKKKELEAEINAYTDYKLPTTPTPTPNPQTSTGLSPQELAKKDKTMKSEKDILDARMNLGLYSEQIYYQKLKEIRTNFYGDKKKDVTQMTKEEIQLNREIYNQEVAFTKQRSTNTTTYTKEQTKAYKDMYDSQKSLEKDAYDQNKKLLKSTYDDTKKKLDTDYKDEVSRIDRTLKRKEKSIDSAIKAIDKEIDARKRLKQTEEYDTQIDSLKAQLSYGKMDDFTRREVEAELKRITEEKADYAWELEQTDRKAALNEELTYAKERAERQKANLQELLEINKTAAEEGYSLQIEKLDTTYQMHLTHLETMFDTSSTKMGEISNSFVSTISKGCEEAAKKLSGLISQANSAASRISTVKNYQNIDSSSRSASVNMYGSNYTEAQARRMIDRELYE